MRLLIASAMIGGLMSGACYAQETAGPAAIAATPEPVMPTDGQGVLPANTEVLVTLNSEVNSKKMKTGQKFDVSVSRDVMIGNYIVIPRGTPGVGEITYRTGKGAFGKSAKMEIDLRSLTLGGRDVPLSGHFRQEGTGNTGATVGAAVAVGVFSAFVTGHSAIFEQGRELRGFTREAMPVSMQVVTPVAAPAPAEEPAAATPAVETKPVTDTAATPAKAS